MAPQAISDSREERVPFLERPMGYGTVGSFLLYLIAVIAGVVVLVLLGRYGVFDPHRGL
jgi:hypothetical protein